MNDRIGAIFDVDFESFNSVQKKMKVLKDNIEKDSNSKIKIDIDVNGIKNIENLLKQSINSASKSQKDFIKLKEDEARLLRQIKDDDLKFISQVEDKRKQSINRVKKAEEELQKIQAKYQNKALDDKFKQEQSDLLKLQKELYGELINLQKQEFSIKQKQITAAGEYKNKLQEVLELNTLAQNSIRHEFNNNDKLKNSELENKLIKDKIALNQQLQIAQAKANTNNENKLEKSLLAQNKQLDSSIAKLKTYQSVLNNSGKNGFEQKALNKELEKQIELLEKLKIENKLLGNEERSRIQCSINDLKLQTKELTTKTSGFKDTLKEIIGFAFVGTGTYALLDTLRKSLYTIKELDDAMRDLKRVSDDVSQTTFDNFTKKANEMAMAVGHSTTGVVEASTIFKQLGYSFKEASEYMAKNAMVLSNVGDISVDDSANSIVSNLKAFKMEAEDTTKVVDILNETGNNFAITTGQLAEGLRVGSASLAISGNSIEEATAMITTGSEVMRDANVVANGLKSVSMNLRGLESEDGFLTPKLRETIQGVANVDIRKMNGEFKSTYQILNELGKVWDTLGDKEKAFLAEKIAGKHRANVFAAIMQNAEQLEKVYDSAMDSQGSALKEQASYMDSISGKMNQLKENAKGISIDTIDSNSVKNTIDLLNGLVSVVRNVQDSFGTLPIITTLFATFNNKARETSKYLYSMIPHVNRLTSSLQKMSAKQEAVISNLKTDIDKKKEAIAEDAKAGQSTTKLVGDLGKLETKLTGAKIKMFALKAGTVALNAALTMGLSIAISAVVSKISELHVSAKELKEANEELLSSVKDKMETNNDMIKYLQEEGKEYDSLSKKTSLNADEQDRLRAIKEKLAETSPELVSGFNSETGEIELQSKSVAELIELYKEKNRLANMELLAKGDDGLKTTQKQLKDIGNDKEAKQKKLDRIKTGYYITSSGNAIKDDDNIQDLEKKLKSLDVGSKEYAKTQEKLNKLYQKRTQLMADLQVENDKEKTTMQQFQPYINAIIGQYKDLTETQKKLLKTSMDFTPEDLKNFGKGDFAAVMAQANELIAKIQNSPELKDIELYAELEEPTSEDYEEYYNKIVLAAKKTNSKPIEISQEFKVNPKNIDRYIEELREQIKKASGKNKKDLEESLDFWKNKKAQIDVEINVSGQEELDDVTNKMDENAEKLKDIFNNSFGNIEKYNGFLKEIAEQGKLSSGSIKEVLINYPQLVGCLNNEKLIREELNKLIDKEKVINKNTIKEMMRTDETFYKNKMLTTTSWVNDVAKKYKVDLSNYKNIAQAKMEVEKKMLAELNKQYGNFYKIHSDGRLILDRESYIAKNPEPKRNDYFLESSFKKDHSKWFDAYAKANHVGIEQNREREDFLKEMERQFDESMKSMDGIIDDIGNAGSMAEESMQKGVDKTEKLERAMSETEKAVLKTEQALKKLQDRMNDLNRQQEKLNEHSEEYRKGLREKQKILKETNKDIEKQISLNKVLMNDPRQRNGFDGEKYSAQLSGGSAVGNQLVQEAEKFLGLGYIWGGTTPAGFDCSGLVQYVYKQLGYDITRTTYTQVEEGIEIAKKDLQAGDLVFFKNNEDGVHHVALYAGNGKVIHSPQTGDVVKYSNLDDFTDYYMSRRLLPASASTSSNRSASSGGYNGAYANEINNAARSYGIDPKLLAAIAKVESNFNPGVTSSAGAQGMFQFMPGTAKEFGVNPWDVQSSANGAAKYLKYLINMFNGDLNKAITAYNAGEGNVINGTLKQESIDYLPKVKNALVELGGSYGNYSSAGGWTPGSETQYQYDMQNKISDLQEQQKQNQFEIEQLDIEVLESQIGEYEDKISAVEKKVKYAQEKVEAAGKDNQTYLSWLQEADKHERDKYKILQEQRQFIQNEMNSGRYNPRTIDQLRVRYEELNNTILETNNSIKQMGYTIADTKWNAIKKIYDDNMAMIENKQNILSLNEEKNIKKIIQLNKQKVEQEEANIKRIQDLLEELNEKSKKDPFYLDKLYEYNKELDKANVLLAQHKNELEKVNEKLTSVFNPIESKVKDVITKSVELSKKAIDNQLKHFTDAIDKEIAKLDDAQKQNTWNEQKTSQANKINDLKRQIAELSADDSVESKSKRSDLEKQLKEEMNKSNDMVMKKSLDDKKQAFQKQKEDAQKQAEKEKRDLDVRLENAYLNREVSKSMIDGYVDDITGKRVELQVALLEFEDIFGSGLTLLGEQVRKELIDNLKSAQDLLVNFNKETGGFDFDDKTNVNNNKTKTVYGTKSDIEMARNILGIEGYNYIDTSLVDTSKIQFDENSLILGGVHTPGGIKNFDLNGGTRLEGNDRSQTYESIKLYKAIQDGKIATQNGIVYCSSETDVKSAKKYLSALGYTEFVDMSKIKDLSSLKIRSNDLVVGGRYNVKGGTQLIGNDRYTTDKQVQLYQRKLLEQMMEENYMPKNKDVGTVYASSEIDLVNAKKYLGKYGYLFEIKTDLRDVQLSEKDVVVGGKIQGGDHVLNSGAKWLYGEDRYKTADAIVNFEKTLRGTPGFNVNYSDSISALLENSYDSTESIDKTAENTQKIYDFMEKNVADNFMNSINEKSIPSNINTTNTNNNSNAETTNHNVFNFSFPNIKNEKDANSFSKDMMRIMRTKNLQ